MKKSFAFAFLFCIVSLCGVCGFFLFTQNNATVEITIGENFEDGFYSYPTFQDLVINTESNEPAVYCSNLGANNGYKNYTSSPYYWSCDHIIYDVVLMNFSDYAVFTEENYATYAGRFDEAAEYIATMSRGITTIGFNYYIYNNTTTTMTSACEGRYNFSIEKMYIENGLKNGYCVSSCGKATGRILMFAFTGKHKLHTLPHAHVWDSSTMQERIMIVQSQNNVDTIAHELLHTLGLYDLYNYDLDFDCMDIMHKDLLHRTVNPYSRYKLGWLDESFANDGIETAIETITESGRYTLDNAFSQTGTISFKFGAKNSEMFYIESTMNDSYGRIYVHKVNTKYDCNNKAKTKSQLHIETIGEISGFPKSLTTKITPTYNPITYADGSILNVSIGNVCVEDNRKVSFDFFFGDSVNINTNVVVKQQNTKRVVPNVEIYINDVYQSTTDKNGLGMVSATNGDVMRLQAKGFENVEYYLNSKIINLEMGKKCIETVIVSTSQDDLLYKFKFTMRDADSYYNVSPYDVTFEINGMIIKYFNGIPIAKGDVVKISSRHFSTQTYTFTPFTLKGTNNVTMENNTFHINLNSMKVWYYVNLFNDQEELAEISKIKAFDASSNTWEEIPSAKVVYIHQVPYYYIQNISLRYTRLSFEYTACGMTSRTIVFLENDKYEYKQKLEKTALQIAGDFVTSIGTTIKDFFGGLFNK